MSAAAAPKKRGRPKGSKNKKPVLKASKPLALENSETGRPDPRGEDIIALGANCGPNKGILREFDRDFYPAQPWPEDHKPAQPAYPLNPGDLEWAKDNLRAIGLSEWAVHIESKAGVVIKESIQKLWKRNKRPPSVDEIVQETAMAWTKVEDCIRYLVEDEELRFGSTQGRLRFMHRVIIVRGTHPAKCRFLS